MVFDMNIEGLTQHKEPGAFHQGGPCEFNSSQCWLCPSISTKIWQQAVDGPGFHYKSAQFISHLDKAGYSPIRGIFFIKYILISKSNKYRKAES